MPDDRSISPAPDVVEKDNEHLNVAAAFSGTALLPLKADEIAGAIRILCWEIPPLVESLTQTLNAVDTWLATKQPLPAFAEQYLESSAWTLCTRFEALMKPINQMSVQVCLARWSIEDFSGDEATRAALSKRWFALERCHEDLKQRRFAGRALVEQLHARALTLEQRRKCHMSGARTPDEGGDGGEDVVEGVMQLGVEGDEDEEEEEGGEAEGEAFGDKRIEEGDVPAWVTSL